MSQPPPGDLFAEPTVRDDTIVINERCLVRTNDQQRVILVAGIPLTHYGVGDVPRDPAPDPLCGEGARIEGKADNFGARYVRRSGLKP